MSGKSSSPAAPSPTSSQPMDAAYVPLLCALAGAVAPAPTKLTMAEDSRSVATAKGTARAPANVPVVVCFQVQNKSRHTVDGLLLQFAAPSSFRLRKRVFEPVPNNPKKWSLSHCLTKQNQTYIRDYSHLTRGMISWSAATAKTAVYLLPGEELEWDFMAHLDASKVGFAVTIVADVRAFHQQYTDCLKLANEFTGAVELFQHNHTAEYERILESTHRQLSEEKASVYAARDLNETSLVDLQKQLETVEKQIKRDRIKEEAQQRSHAQQQRDAELAQRVQEARSEMERQNNAACKQARAELVKEANKKKSAKEAQESAEHEKALDKLQTDFEATKASMAEEQAEVEAEIAKMKAEIETMRTEHQQNVDDMVAAKAEETRTKVDAAREEINDDSQAYFKRRVSEAAAIEEVIQNINSEIKLFKTFIALASGTS